MSAHTYSLITIGSNNEPTLSTSKGFSLDPKRGEDERRRLVEALGPLPPEDRVVCLEARLSPFDVVEVFGVPAGEDGRD
jgi:hypothetical protein